MMKLFKRLLRVGTAAVVGATMMTAFAGGFSTANAADQTAVEMVEEMGLGWNLGNSLSAANTWTATPMTPEQIETAWGNPVTTEAMIREISKNGFHTVRIPVTWYQAINGDVLMEEWLARVQQIVDWCYQYDLYVIVDTHMEASWLNVSNQARFTDLWKIIATYFKDYDDHLVFEGMNEIETSAADNLTLNQAFIDTVRATGGNNSDRLLLIAASNNNTANLLSDSFQMPTDSAENRLAVSVHYYEPPTFCVAELDSTWGYSSTWGTAAEHTTLENDFQKLNQKFVQNGVPVIIGEYGVCTDEGKDDASMKDFIRTVASTAYEMEGICPVLWDDSNGGTMLYFNRLTLDWHDPEIGQIFSDILNGQTGPGMDKTDRVTFAASEITQIDSKTGKEYLQIDLKPYKELGLSVSTVVVNYNFVSAKNSAECSGDINMNFNIVDANGENQWAYLDNAIGPNETSTTFEMPSGMAEFVLETDDDGNPVSSVTGKLDMDYLKFENWWTWSAASGDTCTVEWGDVTVIFDGEFYLDNPGGETTTTKPAETTEPKQTTSTTASSVNPPAGDAIGQAYFIGGIGASQNWSAGEDAGAKVTPIYGDGKYTVTWDVTAGGGTDTVQFLAVLIEPDGDAENFTTDTFEGLTVTLDEIWIDGVQLTDYAVGDKSINTRYYEGENPGVTRIYLRDDWATKIGDLPSKTTITQEVKVVFTIGGTGITGTVTEDTGTTTAESTTTTSESTTVTTETTTTTTTATTTTRKPIEDIDPNAFYGDVNLDAKIDLTDAIILNKFCADTVQLNDQQLANANCDAMGGVDLNDTIVLLQFLVHLVNELPYQG